MSEANAGQSAPDAGKELKDRSIGSIIAETRDLSADQVARVLNYQREKNVRFGEAAIALGFANADDVLFALAQQFHYPYAPEVSRNQNAELITLNQPFSAQAEFFRAVRSQLMMRVFNEQQSPRRALAVVSANQGDGKSFFAANLAVTLAQLGGRTLLIDADLRGPRQHEVFGVQNTSGLSGILAGRTEGQAIQPIKGVPNLFLLPVGITPPNPLELLERPAFGLLLRELVSKFDYVIVDTPAAELGSDAVVIASRCGAAMPLARKSESKLATFQELVAGMADASTLVTGAVLNEY
ncbi:polysaccharide biosynthesis tyrosine autokinase [Paucibacter sp. DJ1R-11]|uniref:polysaccharide biosynthesis tyrosine autokinase n=1 Tax=Paucibacter sp. DJ1R-11 TaxID=2893556 RepID=UPI0021E35953|nr:polysaccharide biosynthesis tyrosine autokinase [Paucibacter sp. DJ1R-11]MCV2365061.1 polysaccharide biosynthesis tyrosine autokinase [Paucibacter sp. DJ1R-11]